MDTTWELFNADHFLPVGCGVPLVRAWRHRAGAKPAEHRSSGDNRNTRAACSDDRPDTVLASGERPNAGGATISQHASAGDRTGRERTGTGDHAGSDDTIASADEGGDRAGQCDHQGQKHCQDQQKDQEKAKDQPAAGDQKVDRKRHGTGALPQGRAQGVPALYSVRKALENGSRRSAVQRELSAGLKRKGLRLGRDDFG